MSSERQMSFDTTENFHGGSEESVAAFRSLSHDDVSTAKNAIVEELKKLKRVGLTCDEIEQYLVVNGRLLSHQTASSRCTDLQTELKIVVRYDETPTKGRYRSTRLTRSHCGAAVYIAAEFADGYELDIARTKQTRRKAQR